jgi:TrmH family RNA methyltransferase
VLSASDIKYLRTLLTKKGRRQEGRFLAEGVRLLEEAAAGRYLPRVVFYAPAELSERGQKLIARFSQLNVETTSVSAKEASRLSDGPSSQGVIALFDIRTNTLEEQLRRDHRRILVCDRIGDPGNLGTLMRAAAAFGFDLMLVTDGTAEIENPKTIRASAGAFFRVPTVAGLSGEVIGTRLKAANYMIILADTHGRDLASGERVPERLALVIGSEATGIDQRLASQAQLKIRISTTELVESLNAAMAGTVLMHRLDAAERNRE